LPEQYPEKFATHALLGCQKCTYPEVIENDMILPCADPFPSVDISWHVIS